MERLEITRTLSIPMAELSVSFSRSSGAGGQNVNKVSTRVEMRFDVARNGTLSEGQRAMLLKRLSSRLTAKGVLVVNSDRHRTQGRNREDCQERLAAILAQALKAPPPKRRKTRPGRAAQRRRLDAKKRQGEKKSSRRRPQL
mgnify:FL=1|jgi:ribosome-associated protein